MFAALLLSVLLQAKEPLPVMSFSSYFGNERFDFSVTQIDLAESPKWLASSPTPPLEIREAIRAARTKLVELVPSAVN